MGIMDILNPAGAIADIGLGVLNYNQQKANLRYQKSIQQQAWEREDNATQRRVADLKAAGLSPTLAAGSAAQASAPISTHAPQYSGPSMQDKALNYLSHAKMKADVATTVAQQRIAEAKAREAEHDADINTATPGVTSAQNAGPLGYAKALVGFLGSDVVRNALNEMFTFKPTKPAKPSGNQASTPKNSATISQYKKNNGYAPDVEAWSQKMKSFWETGNQSAGGGGGGAW